MDAEIKFRVALEDKARFDILAKADDRNLSDWVRRACFEKAGPDMHKIVFTGVDLGKPGGDKTAKVLVEDGKIIAAKLLPNDPKEVAKVVGVDPAGEDHGAIVHGEMKDGVLTVDSVETGDTRTQQERMDDFYRSNMAGKKK